MGTDLLSSLWGVIFLRNLYEVQITMLKKTSSACHYNGTKKLKAFLLITLKGIQSNSKHSHFLDLQYDQIQNN